MAVALTGAARGLFSQGVTVKIDAHEKAGFEIPRTIFGSFLEPIRSATYGGLWAEILENPSFEENLWSADNVAQMIREEPALARASSLGLPLPWEPLDEKQGNRYEPRWGDAANSGRSLAVFGLPGKQTGIKQKVYLPAARELQYNGSLYVKHLSGPAAIKISLRRRNHSDEVFAVATVAAAATDWSKYTFHLELPKETLTPLEPADFVIEVEGDERTLIDQASLMPADAIEGLDREMVAMAKAMSTPLVRFGGNFTSGYHWRDGVGPREKRVSMLNIAWGMPEYNQFGTDEFLRFCELIGAQPQIALNLGSGTPEEAAGWVRYVDEHWHTHSGLLWELGNELWGNWNLGYPTLEELPGKTLAFSKAIRKADPNARLIATGQDPDHYADWNAAELSNPPGTFDYLSTHFVVGTDRTEDQSSDADALAADTFALPVELGRRLRAMQGQIEDSPNFRHKAHIAFTEWLFVTDHGGPIKSPRWDNMGGAVAAGSFLNMLIGNADVAPISDMTGIVEFAGISKRRGTVFAAPAYYALRMYSTADANVAVKVTSNAGHYDVHGGIHRLPEIADVPYLDLAAVLNKRGDRLTLFSVNRHLTRDITADIAVNGFAAGVQASVESLFAPSIYDANDETQPEAITPLHASVNVGHSQFRYTFRHESVTKIELSAK